jgi:hypothetical protein
VVTRPEHTLWEPHGYQARAVDFLMERGAAALFMDPGLGKTSIVLEAFRRMKAEGQADRMLVVAPLRVCQLVWQQEGRKWTQFRDLTFSLLHGSKKADRLEDDVDIHLINPEGVAWLAQQFYGRGSMIWDTVVIDELTKFKNHRAARSKSLRKKLGGARRRWGLTGSPAPNGYMDLFGQMLILDDGAALGRHITYYRDQYFVQGYNGFDWGLRGGADARIEARIAPYVLRMASADYLELPPLHDNIIPVQLPPEAQKQYEEMKRDMLLTLPEGVVTAGNAGAVYSKLKQMANGAVYLGTGKDYVELHSAKLDALEDLIESLAGQPLLVAYEFQHDLERLRARLGEHTPTLSGLSHARIAEVEGQWNRGELQILLVHPASAGHGLNLQGAGASHICWFSRPWDLEMYEQTIRRIYRQGSTSGRVVNHVLSVSGTMDDTVGKALEGKDTTQQRLLSALNAEVMRDTPAPHATGDVARQEEDDMVRKLGFRDKDAGTPDAGTPKGWGAVPKGSFSDEDLPPTGAGPSAFEDTEDSPRPKGWGAPASSGGQQRAEIRSKLAAPAKSEDEEEEMVPASVRAFGAFPAGVVDALSGDTSEDEDEDGQMSLPMTSHAPAAHSAEEPKKRTRRKKEEIEQVAAPVTADPTPVTEDAAPARVEGRRAIEVPPFVVPSTPTYARFSLEFSGLPSEALAAIFDALAAGVRSGK